jgi:hypothetical protein
MITDTDIYLDVSPVDLWRCGDDKTPLLDYIRTEGKPPLFRVDMEVRRTVIGGRSVVTVGPNQGGVSVFDNINQDCREVFGGAYPKVQ